MRKSFLLFILLFPFVKSQSQPITFIRNYVFGELSGLHGEVIQTHDSGYATLCHIDTGLSIIKSNAYGDTLWIRNYAVTSDWTPKIAEKNGGGYYILYFNDCGAMWSCSAIISTDSAGNILWSQTYNLGYSTHLSKMIVGNENQIYLGGWFLYDISGDQDEVLIKLDSSGSIIFQKIFLKSTFDRINSLCIADNGDYYFVSSCDSFLNASAHYTRVTRTDSGGSVIWSTKIDSLASGFPDLAITLTNEVYALVPAYDTEQRASVIKFDNSGNILWKKIFFPFYFRTLGRSIAIGSSGNIAITGGIIDSVYSSEDHKIFFLLMDPAGNEIASSLYMEAFAGYSIYPTLDNGYIIGADDSNPAAVETGFYLIKTNGLGEVTGVFDPPLSQNLFRVYPNPSSGIFSINLSGEKNSMIDFEVFNTLGQRIQTFSASRNNSAALDFSNYPEGLYFLTGKDQFKSYLGKIIISR